MFNILLVPEMLSTIVLPEDLEEEMSDDFQDLPNCSLNGCSMEKIKDHNIMIDSLILDFFETTMHQQQSYR